MKKIFLTLLLSAFCFLVVAQPPRPTSEERQRIETLKIAFFTQKLGLNPAESQKFWPVYNQYWASKRDLASKTRAIFKQVKGDTGTGSELQQYLDLQQSEYNNTKKWAEEFKKILPQNKVVKVFWAEEAFKHYLLTELKK